MLKFSCSLCQIDTDVFLILECLKEKKIFKFDDKCESQDVNILIYCTIRYTVIFYVNTNINFYCKQLMTDYILIAKLINKHSLLFQKLFIVFLRDFI